MGNPVGIGMSQELDSNMALIALLQCFGAYIQNADARITIKSKGTATHSTSCVTSSGAA